MRINSISNTMPMAARNNKQQNNNNSQNPNFGAKLFITPQISTKLNGDLLRATINVCQGINRYLQGKFDNEIVKVKYSRENHNMYFDHLEFVTSKGTCATCIKLSYDFEWYANGNYENLYSNYANQILKQLEVDDTINKINNGVLNQ